MAFCLPLLASAYGFCQKEAKTSDNFFLGFPSYWNIIAFYLYVLQSPPWINAFAILLLSILVFVPIKYIYPSRSPYFRALTNSLGSLWGLAVLAIIYLLPEPPRRLVLHLCCFQPIIRRFLFGSHFAASRPNSSKTLLEGKAMKTHRWFFAIVFLMVAIFIDAMDRRFAGGGPAPTEFRDGAEIYFSLPRGRRRHNSHGNHAPIQSRRTQRRLDHCR